MDAPTIRSTSPVDDLRDAVAKLAPSVVAMVTRRHHACGLAWRDGVIVSSAALLWREGGVSAVLPGGEPVAGSVRGVDPATDLAAITFPADMVPLPELADAASLRVGDEACAVGRSSSGALQAKFGRIGAVGDEWRTWRGGRVDRFIELDGHLRPGFEGAPVADPSGRVLGIASHAFTRHTAVVVPRTTIDRVLDELLAHGRVRHGYIGVAAQPVRASLDGAAIDGLLVSSIAPDGPAARGGVQVADVIVQAGGVPTPHLEALRDALSGGAAGRLVIARGGRRVEVDVTAGERPGRRRCG